MTLLTASVASFFFVSVSTSDHSVDTTIERLATWLEGDFSNMRFIIEQGGSGQPPILLQHRIVREESDHPAVAVKQSWLSQPSQGYRYQLVRFDANRDGSVRQIIYPLTAEAYGQVVDNQPLAAEFIDTLTALDGCDIRWTDAKSEFHGERRGDYCSFSDEYGEVVHWQTTLTLDPYQYTVNDAAYTSSGEPIIGQVDGLPVINERIRFFTADIQFLPAGANSNQEDAWVTATTRQPLHDHEQRVALMDADGLQFFGHELQVLGDARNPEELQVRVYRYGEEQPLNEFTIKLEAGDGQAEGDRVRLRLRVTE